MKMCAVALLPPGEQALFGVTPCCPAGPACPLLLLVAPVRCHAVRRRAAASAGRGPTLPPSAPLHIVQLIDAMLTKDRLFTIALPRLPSRLTLERAGQLEPRVSVLDEEFDEAALEVRWPVFHCYLVMQTVRWKRCS